VKPGRELDCRIHREIFGIEWAKFEPGVNIVSVLHYSTSIADAWWVVQKMEGKGHPISINRQSDDWEAIFWESWTNNDPIIARAETLPHAICLAALKALGHAV
jgi:hypothetical protein